MESLYADLRKMERAASSIRSDASEYRRLAERLLRNVAQQKGWTGTDQLAFEAQFEGFRDNMEQMADLMEAYAQMIEAAGKLYRQAQENIVAEAKRLW